LTLVTFTPESTFETFGAGADHPLAKRADASLEETAVAFVEEKLGVDGSAVKFRSGYSAPTGDFAYIRQQHVSTILQHHMYLFLSSSTMIGRNSIRQLGCERRLQG
jgi:hypothetical protein